MLSFSEHLHPKHPTKPLKKMSHQLSHFPTEENCNTLNTKVAPALAFRRNTDGANNKPIDIDKQGMDHDIGESYQSSDTSGGLLYVPDSQPSDNHNDDEHERANKRSLGVTTPSISKNVHLDTFAKTNIVVSKTTTIETAPTNRHSNTKRARGSEHRDKGRKHMLSNSHVVKKTTQTIVTCNSPVKSKRPRSEQITRKRERRGLAIGLDRPTTEVPSVVHNVQGVTSPSSFNTSAIQAHVQQSGDLNMLNDDNSQDHEYHSHPVGYVGHAKSKNRIVGHKDQNDGVVFQDGQLIFDPIEHTRRLIEMACLDRYCHSGTSMFRHISRPGSIGNIFPKRPVVGDSVCLTFRLGDHGSHRVFADRTEYTTDVKGREHSDFVTIGILELSDKFKDDLVILTGNRQHVVVGEITEIRVLDLLNPDVLFAVEWNSSLRCSII